MARTMYDAVTAGNIPAGALVVAGYDDGFAKWSAGDWARFPNAIHVHISSLGTDTGDILDCEPGNPNAVQSVNWVLARRAAGRDPGVYTAEWAAGYRWVDVCAAHDARGVARPHWWKAPGAAGDLGSFDGYEPYMVQISYPGPFDLGVAADHLAGIEPSVSPIVAPLPGGGDEEMAVKGPYQYGEQELDFFIDGSGNCIEKWYDTKTKSWSGTILLTGCLPNSTPGVLIGAFGDPARIEVVARAATGSGQNHAWWAPDENGEWKWGWDSQ